MFIPSSRLRVPSTANVTNISDLAMGVASEVELALGVYKRRQLLVRRSVINSDGTLERYIDVILSPRPRVTLIGPEMQSLFQAETEVKLSQEDYLVTGVPTSFAYDSLFKDIEFYIIDPVFNNSKTKIIDGLVCKPILRYEKKIASRGFVLREEADYDFGNGLDYFPP